jgi:hypothetical protein
MADEDDRRQVLEHFLVACALLFADGFESGDTAAWSAAGPEKRGWGLGVRG